MGYQAGVDKGGSGAGQGYVVGDEYILAAKDRPDPRQDAAGIPQKKAHEDQSKGKGETGGVEMFMWHC